MLADASEQPKATPKRLAPVTGTAALILGVLAQGPTTVAGLVKACKVKDAAIRRSLADLGTRVHVVAGSWPRRYELVKR